MQRLDLPDTAFFHVLVLVRAFAPERVAAEVARSGTMPRQRAFAVRPSAATRDDGHDLHVLVEHARPRAPDGRRRARTGIRARVAYRRTRRRARSRSCRRRRTGSRLRPRARGRGSNRTRPGAARSRSTSSISVLRCSSAAMCARSGVNFGSAPGRLHAAETTAIASMQTAVLTLTMLSPYAVSRGFCGRLPSTILRRETRGCNRG